MGLYRDETGRVIDVPDNFAEARGYTPLTSVEHEDTNAQAGIEARGTERGALGSVNAALTGFESALTLGGSDYLLGKVLPDAEREQLNAEMAAHPYLRAGGEIAGTLAGAMTGPFSGTPGGYLSNVAQREVERGLEQAGVAGTAKALTAMGAEGAAQSAGQYIGHASLEDKELTAEGLQGALGTGFAFGVGGGGAALGVVKGTVAARRMYARVMGGEKAAADAASTWSTASQEALEADQATVRAAEVKLDNIRKAKMEAMRERNAARAAHSEESMAAQQAKAERVPDAADFEEGIKTDKIPVEKAPAAPGGMPTSVFKKPGVPEGPEPLIDVGEQPQGQVTSIKAKAAEPPAAKTALEEQLAGTKAKLDEGKALKDIPGEAAVPGSAVSPQIPPRGEPPIQPGRKMASNSINDWLSEKAAFDDGELSMAKKIEDIKGARDLRNRRQETLSDIRYKTTEDLLGPQMAKEEKRLADVVEEFNDARNDFESLAGYGPESDGVPGVPDDFRGEQATGRASPGNRKAVEILDDAHEEALLRAKHAADPQEAGQAITEAEELEKLLGDLQAPPLSRGSLSASELRSPHAEQWIADMMADAEKVKRYEQASAKLADELGEDAHPVTVGKAKALRDAERDAERKLYDRATRATDDAADGVHAGPQDRVKASRQRKIDAQKSLDEINVQHQEATHELGAAKKQLGVSESAKKAALKADAKLARVGEKAGLDAQDAGGLLEMIDIPGLPKPSDLPVVGPLLGAWLKYRAMKKVIGRSMGRVPASADARVAVLASQTRDRVARAVDRSLGVIERGAKAGVKAIPPVAGILSRRIYDDGGDDPKKGAPIEELAAARMRELTAYVHTPNAIERDVRRQLAAVTDPDLITAAEKQHRAAMEFLLSVAPPMPEQSILNHVDYRPSPAQAMSFARSYDAVNDAPGVFERLAHEQAMISLEAAEALRRVYPRIFSEAGMRLMERAQEGNLRVPVRQRVQMSLLYKVPLDTALDPVNLKITQSVYDRKPSSPAYNPAAAGAPAPSVPQPAVANPTNLAQALTPSFDRR